MRSSSLDLRRRVQIAFAGTVQKYRINPLIKLRQASPGLKDSQNSTPNSDVIYMVSYLEDAVRLVRHIRRLKIESQLCGGAGGFTLEEFITKAGDTAEKILIAAPWSKQVSYPGTREFYQQYLNRYNAEPDYHGAEAYSALLVAAFALKKARSENSGDIREALNRTFLKTPFGPV